MVEPDPNPLGFQTVDLQPTELTAVKEIQVKLQRILAQKIKSSHNRKTLESAMLSFYDTAVGMYRDIGLVVFIDLWNVEVDQDDNTVLSPEVSVTGRIADEDFDFERASRDTQHGLLDGRVGKIAENGVWKDPDLKL